MDEQADERTDNPRTLWPGRGIKNVSHGEL